MDANTRKFVIMGALGAALAVGLGAFGAHALRSVLSPRMFEVYRTAVLYHLVHCLGLLTVAFVCSLKPDAALAKVAGWLMAAGLILFCGSLYLLAVTGLQWLGLITPVGGLAFVAAWLLLAAAALRP